MGSNRTKVDDTTWGKNGEGWFWVLAGFGIGCLILAAFLDAPGILVVCPFVGGLLGNSLRIIRSLKKRVRGAEIRRRGRFDCHPGQRVARGVQPA